MGSLRLLQLLHRWEDILECCTLPCPSLPSGLPQQLPATATAGTTATASKSATQFPGRFVCPSKSVSPDLSATITRLRESTTPMGDLSDTLLLPLWATLLLVLWQDIKLLLPF